MRHFDHARNGRRLLLLGSAVAAFSGCATLPGGRPRPDIILGAFDGPGDEGWTSSGAAFGHGPALGDARRPLEIEGFIGAGTACSEIDGDGPQGTLTSPEFTIDRGFLTFRAGGGDYEYATCVNLMVEGKVVRCATGWRSDRLTPVTWDLSPWSGRRARVELVDRSSGDWGHLNADQVVLTDTPQHPPAAVAPLYQEALRPQFHFTARQWAVTRANPGMQQEGWINDLNGLIFYDGEYHLFAQRWAKCWLHAVSRDLVHWTELPPAFWEEEQGSGVQSGTIVVDERNTSGLGRPGAPAMVAFWSRFDNRSQCIAFSTDHGRTWTRHPKNPIFVKPERDPKVFWHTPTSRWVMMMYGDGKYHVLTSTNLLDWKDENRPVPDSFECPDLFELPVDGDPARSRWVMVQGSGVYSVGSFDGTRFTEESPRLTCDLGPNFYATQTWENTRTGDGRRIQAAWMRGGVYPDMPFSQQVSFPCELTLRTTPKGVRLFREPVKELALLQEAPDEWSPRTLRDGARLPLRPGGDGYRILAELTLAEKARAVFDIRGSSVTLTRSGVESGEARGTVAGEVQRVELLVDRASIEAFINGGELSSTRCILPTASGISLRAEGGEVQVRSLTVWPIRSAWPRP